MRVCDVVGCGRRHEAKGYCHSHYAAFKRNPDAKLTPYPETPVERFMAKVTKVDGHWIWGGSRHSRNEYGASFYEGKVISAHRVSWFMFRGEIPAGKVVDHICRTPLCVNPEHLRLVTNRENILIGTNPAAKNARKTHCKRGHEFNEVNTRVTNSGRRACRACASRPERLEANRLRMREIRAERRVSER